MNIAIILSGGVGSRMGENIPKQYIKVDSHPIIYYCLKTFIESPLIDAIIIGVADEWKQFVMECVSSFITTKPIYYSTPGETRQYTVYKALNQLAKFKYDGDDIVVIHDAARPLVSHSLIEECVKGCNENDGIMPVIPVKDTTYLSEDGKHITSLLNRAQLFSGQSPEAFLFEKYLKAHNDMSRDELLKINGSSELAYKAGMTIGMVEGDPMNFKITTREDLMNFQSILEKR